VQGSADFKCCAEKPDLIPDSCVVQIAHGWIVKVVYPQPQDWPWQDLPRGRSTDRRRAAGAESYRREFEVWREERRRCGMTLVGSQVAIGLGIANASPAMERMAFALHRPLSRRLDYASIVRELIREVGWPDNYYRDFNGRWVRRKSRRLW